MTESRFGIRPFPRVATYPTSWNGEMTFEQISEDIRPRADQPAYHAFYARPITYRYFADNLPSARVATFLGFEDWFTTYNLSRPL